MVFRFKKSACVVVGTFNMYIIQPPWLAKIGVIPKGTQVGISAKLDEPGFRFSVLTKPSTHWMVSPSRIDLESDSWEEDCGAPIAKVLERLPETPLKGIGLNFIYEASLSEIESLTYVSEFSPVPPEGYDLAQRSLHVGFKRGEQTFNLQLSVLGESIEIAANIHTDLEDKEGGIAQGVTKDFLGLRNEAETIVRGLFKVSITHDSDSRQG